MRDAILQHIRTALARWPDAQIFLLYSPGMDDPLRLQDFSADTKGDITTAASPRTVARIPWGRLPVAHQSQVIELDCRKVAPYLLEFHPGFDDPLLEESLSLAKSYLQGQLEAEIDEPRGRHVAGWLVSTDTADAIAHRFAQADAVMRTRSVAGYGLAWHDPRTVGGVWHDLGPKQREALLGQRTLWIAVDALGQVVRWSADPQNAAISGSTAITAEQRAQWQNSPAVLHLLEAWREQCDEQGSTCPEDAMRQLHRLVLLGRQAGLDGEDLYTYVLWSTRLRPGFESEPAVRRALAEAAEHPDTLAQTLPAALTGPLLARYALGLPESNIP